MPLLLLACQRSALQLQLLHGRAGADRRCAPHAADGCCGDDACARAPLRSAMCCFTCCCCCGRGRKARLHLLQSPRLQLCQRVGVGAARRLKRRPSCMLCWLLLLLLWMVVILGVVLLLWRRQHVPQRNAVDRFLRLRRLRLIKGCRGQCCCEREACS
jgi:hypothetical protein